MDMPNRQILRSSGSPPRPWVAIALGVGVLVSVVAILSNRSTRAAQPGPQPLPMRLKLIEGMAGESILESVAKLDDYKDFSITSAGLIVVNSNPSQEAYRFHWECVPKLNRVRKICSELGATPEEIRAQIKQQLRLTIAKSNEGFDELFKTGARQLLEMKKALDAGESANDSATTGATSEVLQRIRQASSSAYLLGELHDHEALPILWRSYRQEGRVPVPRVFGFAIMQELAWTHPEGALSPRAANALAQYKNLTRGLPRATRISVPSWDAEFNESDFRLMLLKQEIDLKSEPMVEMTIYPQAFFQYEDWRGIPKPELVPFVNALGAFVDAAYPDPAD